MSNETPPAGQNEALFDLAQSWLRSGHKVAIAIVKRTWGSAPRQRGAIMVIRDDGLFEGSVSGGCVEGEVIAAAQDMLSIAIDEHQARPRSLHFGVEDEAAWQVGLACGGEIEVLVIHVANKTTRGDEPCDEYLNENHIAALASAVRERKTLSISVDPDTGRADLAPDTVRSTPDEGETNVRISTHPTPRLFITGAVHIAQPLCRMARDVGFDVNIIDPRTGFAREERFPGIPLIKEWPDEALAETPPDAATAIVTLTHDPKLDDAALIPALQSSAFYIGALGSRRTHEKRKARLREAGVSFEAIERISAPVGLPLGGRGPAEIALAITAELVKARYQSMTPTADAM